MFHRHTFENKQAKEKVLVLSVLWAVFAAAFLIIVRAMF